MGFFDNVNANLRGLFEGKFRVGEPHNPYINESRFEYFNDHFTFKSFVRGEWYPQTYNYSDILELFHSRNINIGNIKELCVPNSIRMFGMLEITVVYKDAQVGNYQRVSVFPANLTPVLNDYKVRQTK